MTLDIVQLRVLGALIEKEITTPENYPLSLNALIAASNQRSSREPVMDLTEDEVRQAIHSLEDMDMVAAVRDARVPKYEHRIRTVLNLRRDETAVICLLLLRGPQTPGELRGRADRMYSFDDIAAVQATLERLAGRGGDAAESAMANLGPLVVQLPRQPGSRESRYAHLLGGPVEASNRDAGGYGDTAKTRVSGGASERGSTGGDFTRVEAEIEARLETRFGERIDSLANLVGELLTRIETLEGGR